MNKSLIPHGLYCYSYTGEQTKNGIPTTKTCPYWKHVVSNLKEPYAYCGFIDDIDDMLLVDMCKICNVNIGDEDV